MYLESRSVAVDCEDETSICDDELTEEVTQRKLCDDNLVEDQYEPDDDAEVNTKMTECMEAVTDAELECDMMVTASPLSKQISY